MELKGKCCKFLVNVLYMGRLIGEGILLLFYGIAFFTANIVFKVLHMIIWVIEIPIAFSSKWGGWRLSQKMEVWEMKYF